MKMSQLKMAIREVVREEIQIGLKEIIGELKQPTQIMTGATGEIRRNTKPPKKQKLSNNPVLNEVLNETAVDEWETMGGTQYTSERMNELVGGSYSDMMAGNQPQPSGVTVDGQTADFLQKDYRELMKAVDNKKR
jgi:hypothetical protein